LSSGATSLAAADFDNDGNLDLAMTTPGLRGVSVMLGNGNGSFQPPRTFATGSDPRVVVVADFNADGKLDLAVANFGTDDVSILPGNGDGTFQAGSRIATGLSPVFLVASDFNSDGIPDLAVLNAPPFQGSAQVTTILGNGDGTFRGPHTDISEPVPNSVAVGDFNRDGKVDLVISAPSAGFSTTAGRVSELLGNGDGTFQGAVALPSIFPGSVVVGDFDRDGVLDLAILDGANPPQISTLLGNGDGSFRFGASRPFGDYSWSQMLTADVDGDGRLDLVVLSFSGSIRTFLGNG
jgi:hypothetical protein